MRKFQELAMQTHLEVQQREDIRRDLAERMKFVLPDLRACRRTCVQLARRSEQNPVRTEIWKMVEGGNHCSQGLHGSCQYRCDHASGKHKQAEETIRHWIWKNFRTPVSEQQRLCCGSLVKVKLMFGRCSRTTLLPLQWT